jgi:hypothetical protein
MTAKASYELVAATAQQLRAEGKRPSIESIRALIGGSPNTIQPHLKRWREAQPVPKAAERRPIPDTVAAAWHDAVEREVAASRANLESELGEARNEIDMLAGSANEFEARCEALQSEVAKLQEQIKQHEQLDAERAHDLKHLREQIEREQSVTNAAQIETAEARVQIKQQADKINDLAAELSQAREQAARAQAETQEAKRDAAVAVERASAAADRVRVAEAAAEAANQRAQRERDEVKSLQKQLSAAQAQAQAHQVEPRTPAAAPKAQGSKAKREGHHGAG